MDEYKHLFSIYSVVLSSSLHMIATDLEPATEAEFRSFMTKRLESSIVSFEQGTLYTLDFHLKTCSTCDTLPICYCEYLPKNTEEGNAVDDNDVNEKGYLVCLLTSSEVNLEFFSTELHDFCQNFGNLFTTPESVRSTAAISYLASWHNVALRYLCRSLKLFNMEIAALFYLASMESHLEIEGGEDEIRNDILRFIKSCSIAEMIGGTQVENLDNRRIAKLTFDDSTGKPIFSGIYDCADYFKEWAKQMLDGDVNNPTFLKQVIENFKLTTVQSMNTFKRLLINAETDYYALYRAFLFLKNSKTGGLLLQHAKQQDGICSNSNTMDVLNVLNHFITASAD